MVTAACDAGVRAPAFSLAGNALWLGKVEQLAGRDALKVHYYRPAQQQPLGGCAAGALLGVA